MPHQGEEVFGLDRLEKISETLYEDLDPTLVFHNENPFEVKETKNAYEIRLKLPFIQDGDFELKKFGDELVIDIGNRRKNVFLPRFANFLPLKGHHFEKPWLTIELAKD